MITMDEEKKLIENINKLLTDLEAADLKFILKQAEVLEYNRTVRLKRAEAEEQRAGLTGSSGPGAEHESAVQQSVYIEQTDNSKFFNICIGTARLFVDYQEIQALFKIARAAASADEGTPRLYRWFKKERSDVLAEGNIRGPVSPVLLDIYEALLETFTAS